MKTRNLKAKTLSILLTIVMLLGMLPMSVFAADAEDYITVFGGKVNAGQYFAGGSGYVRDDAPSDNYLYYKGDGKITLKNFVHSDATKEHAIRTDNKDVSITLIGESEITNHNGFVSLIVNNGKLQISGDGSLKCSDGISCSGFELSGGTVTANEVTSNGDISITDGELTLTVWSLTVMNDRNISISGGKVTVSGNRYAINATGSNGTVSITGGEVELTARVSGSGGDKAIFAGTLTIGENMQILVGSSAADAVAVDAYNDQMYVKIKPKAKDLTITGGTEGTDYTYENGVLDIKAAGNYEIKNADNVTATDDVIKVSAPSGTVNITLSGVVINVSGTVGIGSWGKAAFEITGECATNLILKDGCENVFDSGFNRAGIANHSHALTIVCEHSESAAHECSTSCGNLRAVGQYGGAGIGGDAFEPGANITIKGGNIVADIVNQNGGAGIGGGDGGNGSNITITGGTVTATGGEGAGIGGGYGGNGNYITISGGKIIAGDLEAGGAGIGGGDGGNGSNITITGGNVVALSRDAGIQGDNITITGGEVLANTVAGIGGLYGDNIKIAPAKNTIIYAYNGSRTENTPLDGSPFTRETDITDLIDGNSSFYCYAEHVHSFSTDWTYDEDSHWHAPTCGHEDAAFKVSHSYGTEWKSDSTSHWHECTCGAKTEEAAHSFGTEWKSDGTNHWRECSCGAKSDEAAHSGGIATCTAKAKCTVCAVEYGNLAEHTYGTEWKSDGTNHWHECTCGAKTEEAAHSGGTATCAEKAKCTACGTEYGNLAEHTYGSEWKSDGTNHWHECSCGAKSDEAAHNGGTATCKDKAVCSVCNIVYGELAAHNYSGGKCTFCEAADPNYVPETDSPQTGDNSHLALWFALLFISGGAIITLTVYERKRRTANR